MEGVELADGEGSAGDDGAMGLEDEHALTNPRPTSMGSAAVPKDAGVGGPRRRGRGKKGAWVQLSYKDAATGKRVRERFLVKLPESVRLANVTIDADPHVKSQRVVNAARARAKAKAAKGPATGLRIDPEAVGGGRDVGDVDADIGGRGHHDEDPRDVYLANLRSSMRGTRRKHCASSLNC